MVLNGINRFIRREKGTRTLAGASSVQRCCLALLFPAVCLALVFSLPSPAAASYFDTFGVDARGMALGNTMAAWSEGWASVHYNPAALALSRDIEFSLGFNYASHNIKTEYVGSPEQGLLQFPGSPGGLDSIPGPSFGLLVPIQRLTSRKLPTPIALGVGVFIPRQSFSTSRAIEETFPVDVIFNGRNSSLALDFAVSTRITPFFYIGVGLATQIRTGGTLNVSDVGEDAFEYNVRFGAPTVLAGILVRPTERIRVGFTYRQKNEIRTSWSANVQTRFTLGTNPPIALYTENNLEKNYVTDFTPDNFSLGAVYKFTQRLKVSLQVDLYLWSEYQGPEEGVPLQFGFNDIFVPRLGIAYKAMRKLEIRAGFYYEPTPVTNQATGFYPMGNDRFVPSLGVGYALDLPWNLLDKPVMIDGFFQYHILQSRSFVRAVSSNPVVRDPSLTSSGSVLNLGCSLTFHF